jgi:hypothetical protein
MRLTEPPDDEEADALLNEAHSSRFHEDEGPLLTLGLDSEKLDAPPVRAIHSLLSS